ncbi:hypothetical protein GGR50DRAFT_589553 [Xylaria sp. CBS 124048]|nr:hypothetical protein GGR50DRAFT_589553 [Xylaria sp. CBS 124048]
MASSAENPSSTTTSSTTSESATAYTRLHITPFDPSFQNLVIPASVLPRARNISYHTIETFPEKRFGFVDLPTMDADKIKKKLNGAVLKGSKIRVETARPESKPEPTIGEAEADDTAKASKKEKKKSKKRKHEPDVMEGVQLEGRKVKRGWTTTEQEMIEEKKRKKVKKDKKEEAPADDKKSKKDKDKKKKRTTVKSKYTDEPECLFKTKLAGPGPAKEEAEDDADASARKHKRKRKSDREVVIHEFEKTTKYPSFLKSTSTGGSADAATTFEEGVGWVDSTGKVVEKVKTKKRAEGIPTPDLPKSKKEKVAPKPVEESEDDETSSSGSSSSSDEEDDDDSSSDSESEVPKKQPEIPVTPKQPKVARPAPSGPSPATKPDSATRPKSAGSMTNLSIKIPQVAKEVHPLEALYKKPQGDTGTTNADAESKPFSFFGNEDDIEEDGESSAPSTQVPMTPFTKREFEFRNIRSAAPTPDTAHPSRSFHWPSGDAEYENEGGDDSAMLEIPGEDPEDEDVDIGGEVGTNGPAGSAGGEASRQTPTSDFQKQFWESRGDLNRAWRKRRKMASKEKRYRDNRARAERAI